MTRVVWWNGDIVPANAARIPVGDRGFLLGEALFETLSVVNGHPWKAERHRARINEGLMAMGISWHFGAEDFPAMTEKLCHAGAPRNGIFRVTVTSGEGGRGLLTDQPASHPMVLATLDAPSRRPRQAVHALLSDVTRDPASPSVRWKTTGRPDLIMAQKEVRVKGAEEAIICSPHGLLVGFARGCLLLEREGHWWTPGREGLAFPGTTLRELQYLLLAEGGIPYADISVEALMEADGIYLLNSLEGILPVDLLHGRPLASRERLGFQQLSQLLRASVIRECGAFEGFGILPWH